MIINKVMMVFLLLISNGFQEDGNLDEVRYMFEREYGNYPYYYNISVSPRSALSRAELDVLVRELNKVENEYENLEIEEVEVVPKFIVDYNHNQDEYLEEIENKFM